MTPDELALQNARTAIGQAHFYLQGLPAFAQYFGLALLFTAIFMAVYPRITSHNEYRLVRAGNLAAVLAFVGALVGFALPMKAAMAGSANLVDFAVWAVIAGIVQVAAYFLARFVMPDVSRRIDAGETVGGVWLGGIAVLVGILNSSAMTY